MDTPNAFIGKTTLPSAKEINTVLGASAALWKQLVDWLAEQGVVEQEWKSSSPKYGWSFLLNLALLTSLCGPPANRQPEAV